MSDAAWLDKCRADLLRSRTACENQKHIIIDLSDRLADTQQRLAECEGDAERWRLIREHIAPAYLEGKGFTNLGDILEGESISERIDRMVDAAIDAARGDV